MSKASENRLRARERLAQERARAARRRRRNWGLGGGAGAAVIAAAVAIIVVVAGGGSGGPGGGSGGGTAGPLRLSALSTLGALRPAPPAGPIGPEGVPVPAGKALAGTAGKASGAPVDRISCSTSEQTLFHIHAHLTVFVNGVARQVPAGIGIPGAQAQDTAQGPFIASGTCFYWLHTHVADGIIHIESPVRRAYTLGEFFDEWRQPLGPGQVGPARGHVTAIYNGKVYRGNPRDIPLAAHAQIQLEVSTPLIAPESIAWPSGL
jgi:hypothetical protein